MGNDVHAVPPSGSKPVSRLAATAFGLAILVILVAMISGLGARWGLWHFSTGFQLLRWAAYGGVLAAVLGIAGMIHARPGSGRRGLVIASLALVIGLVSFAVPWQWVRTARSVPPVHDITTDTENPPAFVAIAPLRADAPNEIEYGGPEIAEQQLEAYPDVQPLILDVPPDEAFRRAEDTAENMGWRMVAVDPAEGRIEATDVTFWYGFEDDVVIRVTPTEDGRSRVDVRSLSRVGGSDVGTNAKRIRKYLDRLSDA